MSTVLTPNHPALARIFPGSFGLKPADIFVPAQFEHLAEEPAGMQLHVRMLGSQLRALLLDGASMRHRRLDFWGFQHFDPYDIRYGFPEAIVDDEHIRRPLFYAKMRRMNEHMLYYDLAERDRDGAGRGCINAHFDALARAAAQSGYTYIGAFHMNKTIAAHFIESLGFYLLEEIRPAFQGRFDGNPAFGGHRADEVYNSMRFVHPADAETQARSGARDESAEARLAYRKQVHSLLRAMGAVRTMLGIERTGGPSPGIASQIASFEEALRLNTSAMNERDDLLSALTDIVREALDCADALDSQKAKDMRARLSRALRMREKAVEQSTSSSRGSGEAV